MNNARILPMSSKKARVEAGLISCCLINVNFEQK